MKRTILYMLLLLVVACEKDEKPEDVLEVSLQQIEMKYTKDASLVIVTTLNDWEVEEDADWIQLSAYEGEGKTGFIVGAEENPSFSRESVVTIKAGEMQQLIHVRQSANPKLEIKVNDETIRFVVVDSGVFLIGNNHHPVSLSEFYISETEVTNAVWKIVMDTLPGQLTEIPYLPVSNVTWDVIDQQFLPAINQLTGITMSLPSEAQWEFAARGGTKSLHYEFSGSNELDEVAWSYTTAGNSKQPVGRKKANELGLYDMSGNLGEWCSDWYEENYGITAFTDTVLNPRGPSTGIEKVVKGGNYSNGMFFNWVCFEPLDRTAIPPDGFVLAGNKIDYIQVTDETGFRLAISKP